MPYSHHRLTRAYDGLNRLTNTQRGALAGTYPGYTGVSGTPAIEQQFTLDFLGNWNTYLTKTAGTTDLSQTRYNNLANEITGNGGSPIVNTIGSAWIQPAYDLAGNMTAMPSPLTPTAGLNAIYDAWNRLVRLTDGSSNVIADYRYDGLNHRIRKYVANGGNWDVTDYYYNPSWQVLEERKTTGVSRSDTPLFGIGLVVG